VDNHVDEPEAVDEAVPEAVDEAVPTADLAEVRGDEE
jgi:hypothetical protein